MENCTCDPLDRRGSGTHLGPVEFSVQEQLAPDLVLVRAHGHRPTLLLLARLPQPKQARFRFVDRRQHLRRDFRISARKRERGGGDVSTLLIQKMVVIRP